MANVNKSALVSITRGKATGFARIRFNIPEEMRYTFPVSDLFKMDIIGFNVEKIECKEDQGKNLILMHASIARTNKLGAIFSFPVHHEIFTKMKETLEKDSLSSQEEDNSILLIKKVIESYPPIIQIIPKINI